MRRILIITYDFPPAITGVRRVLSFLRHLTEFGWRPAVLTCKPVATFQYDPSPLDEIRALRVPVFRAGSLDPYRIAHCLRRAAKEGSADARNPSAPNPARRGASFLRRWVFCPDDRCLWIPFATAAGRDLLGRYSFDAFLTTSHPNSAHLVGLNLKKSFPAIPWIADFRDGWTQNDSFFNPPTSIHRWLGESGEKKVARRADLVTAVSDPITDHLRSLCPRSPNKFMTLPNGFEPLNFNGLTYKPSSRFSIAYTGTFFGPRSPETFLRGLNIWLERFPERRTELTVDLYTSLSPEARDLVANLGLSQQVREKGFVAFREALEAQVAADLLLLIVAPGPRSKIMLTQKVFEYLASGR
ncbi:MAG: glycosyltransferase, partial [bacterium]